MLIFYLAIVNTILRHCHSWLAQQYNELSQNKIFETIPISQIIKITSQHD